MGNVVIDGEEVEYADEWAFVDVTNADHIIDIPDGTVVYASCFSQDIPDSIVFRPNMRRVKFYNCNLDNTAIPSGNMVFGGTKQRFKGQRDGHNWIVDENGSPVEPIDLKAILKLRDRGKLIQSRITNPADLPKAN